MISRLLVQILLPKEFGFHLFQAVGLTDALADPLQFLLDRRRFEDLLVARHTGIFKDGRPVFLGIAHGKQVDEIGLLSGNVFCVRPVQILDVIVVVLKAGGIVLVPFINCAGFAQNPRQG